MAEMYREEVLNRLRGLLESGRITWDREIMALEAAISILRQEWAEGKRCPSCDGNNVNAPCNCAK